MLAKIIAYGPDRDTALHRLRAAIERTSVLGVRTNTRFLSRLLAHEDVRAGRLDTGLVESALAELVDTETPDTVAVTAALLAQAALEPADDAWVDPFSVPSGWRLGEPAWTVHRFRLDGQDPVTVRVRGRGRDTRVRVGTAEALPAHLMRCDAETVQVTFDGITETFRHAQSPDGVRWFVTWLSCVGGWCRTTRSRPDRARRAEPATAH